MTIIQGTRDHIREVTQHLAAKRPEGHTPFHQHDCDRCIFVRNGTVSGRPHDWYICLVEAFSSSNGGSLIARFGKDGDYNSFPVATILTWNEQPERNFGGMAPDGFVQQGRALLAELGYRMMGGQVVIDTAPAVAVHTVTVGAGGVAPVKIATSIIANADAVAARAASLTRLLRDGDIEGAGKLARDMRLMLAKVEKACNVDDPQLHSRYKFK